MKDLSSNALFEVVKDLIKSARQQAVQQVNTTMTKTYFEIGKQIVEQEQAGKTRAAYAKAVLKTLSSQLKEEFGKGFSVQNLENMRRVYLAYSKSQTLSVIFEKPINWSQFVFLSRISNENERNFYEIETSENH